MNERRKGKERYGERGKVWRGKVWREERYGEREKGRRGLRYFRVKTLVFTLEEGEGGRVWIEKIEKGSEHC